MSDLLGCGWARAELGSHRTQRRLDRRSCIPDIITEASGYRFWRKGLGARGLGEEAEASLRRGRVAVCPWRA